METDSANYKPTLFDCFAGVGGFSLGFERAGFDTVALCENDPACCDVLRSHWPHVPLFGDVRTVEIESGFADCFTGGFPCQPFSTASRGRKTAVDLWPQFHRLIRSGRPRWVVAENVLGIGHAGCERVCGDLEEAGYRVWPLDLDSALSARQRGRQRLFWVAYADHALHARLALHAQVAGLRALSAASVSNHPRAVGMDDGVSAGLDGTKMTRLKMMGNAVTPFIAELLARLILRVEGS